MEFSALSQFKMSQRPEIASVRLPGQEKTRLNCGSIHFYCTPRNVLTHSRGSEPTTRKLIRCIATKSGCIIYNSRREGGRKGENGTCSGRVALLPTPKTMSAPPFSAREQYRSVLGKVMYSGCVRFIIGFGTGKTCLVRVKPI
jgi:hypothetical protein